jgi:hypothetical protein
MLFSTVASQHLYGIAMRGIGLNSSLQNKENTRQRKMTGCQISFKFAGMQTKHNDNI